MKLELGDNLMALFIVGILAIVYPHRLRGSLVMKIWEVWVEGYVATDHRGKAWSKGRVVAASFS